MKRKRHIDAWRCFIACCARACWQADIFQMGVPSGSVYGISLTRFLIGDNDQSSPHGSLVRVCYVKGSLELVQAFRRQLHHAWHVCVSILFSYLLAPGILPAINSIFCMKNELCSFREMRLTTWLRSAFALSGTEHFYIQLSSSPEAVLSVLYLCLCGDYVYYYSHVYGDVIRRHPSTEKVAWDTDESIYR